MAKTLHQIEIGSRWMAVNGSAHGVEIEGTDPSVQAVLVRPFTVKDGPDAATHLLHWRKLHCRYVPVARVTA